MIRYEDIFSMYAKNTNGKRIIGECLLGIFDTEKFRSCLDVGGGRGEIALMLSSKLNRVVVIEKIEEFCREIIEKSNNNIDVVCGDFQKFVDESTGFDVCIMSYFLDSYSPVKVDKFIKHAAGFSDRILGVTYLDGCQWDMFTNQVSKTLNFPRGGGFSRILSKLRRYNYDAKILSICSTCVFGDNVDDLYRNLSFFFKKNLAGYQESQDLFEEMLLDLCGYGDDRIYIELKEVIYEIVMPK